MSRKAVCHYCKQAIEDNQNFKKYQNRKYHTSCYQKMVQEKYQEAKTETNPKQDLYNYICQLFCIKELSPLIMNQIDKYCADFSFTYDGILYSLIYYYDLQENNIRGAKGIGIVPYIYNEAKEYYILKQKLDNKENNIVLISNKTIHIKKPNYNTGKVIDIENL